MTANPDKISIACDTSKPLCQLCQRSHSPIVLSLFGGAGLLDMGFEKAGFTVLRGPDLLWSSNIKDFCAHSLCGKINGIIAGVPCQAFSRCTKKENRKNHENLWPEFWRVAGEVDADWLLAECVYGAESAATDMFCVPNDCRPTVKRIVFNELGSAQARPRMILHDGKWNKEFWEVLQNQGLKWGLEWRKKIGRLNERKYRSIVGDRSTGSGGSPPYRTYRTILQNGHTSNNKPAWAPNETSKNPPRFIKGDDFLDAFDLPKDWKLPGHAEVSKRTACKLVTQGVPVAAAYALAKTIKEVYHAD